MADAASSFGVLGEMAGESLIALKVDPGQLLESFVRPYEAGDTFILEGKSVSKSTLDRFIIFQPTPYFDSQLHEVVRKMRGRSLKNARDAKVFIDGYPTILQDLVRNHSRDVTNELVTAYQQEQQAVESSLSVEERTGAYRRVFETFTAALRAVSEVKELLG